MFSSSSSSRLRLSEPDRAEASKPPAGRIGDGCSVGSTFLGWAASFSEPESSNCASIALTRRLGVRIAGELPPSKTGDSDAAGDDNLSLAMLCHWVREQLELEG